MKKIISLFQRNYDGDRLVRNELVPGAEWVAAGEGVATRKWDGTCCMVRGGKLFKRFDAKRGKTPPPGFEAAQEPDPTTGHWPGWVPVGGGPEDRWHLEAWRSFASRTGRILGDGTYELCGPKIQGNPEGFNQHELIGHGVGFFEDAPRTFDALREWFANDVTDIEGLVWHHPDGRMVKIKLRDFGIKRKSVIKESTQ
jgi:hypothetical protein